MKKAFHGITTLILVIFLAACGSSDKNTDNQSDNSNSEQLERSDKEANKAKRTASTGRQLVENIVTKLHGKLELNDQQVIDLDSILLKTFQETGNDLDKEYSIEESKIIGKELKVKSREPVLLILNEDQKVRFEKFLNK